MLYALTRDDLATYINAVFIVYIILVFVRVLLSWIPRMPYNRPLRAAVDFVHQTTDPYLNVFRRLLPPLGGSSFALDLSPILGIFVLLIGQKVVVSVVAG